MPLPLAARRRRRCDPIETGTAIRIHWRGVAPEVPHGPFALVEYIHEGQTKIQYAEKAKLHPTCDAFDEHQRADLVASLRGLNAAEATERAT